ncbi:MAG: hypothetical protein EHM49_00735 [Deltaproteobacteria bacterium]|nr:MAG: hypothetical protein EHM49_00735 [Deltaproteobacteria bacterium]
MNSARDDVKAAIRNDLADYHKMIDVFEVDADLVCRLADSIFNALRIDEEEQDQTQGDIENYLEGDYGCPSCGDDGPDRVQEEDLEDDWRFVRFRCPSCGQEWEERWQLKKLFIAYGKEEE